MLKVIVVDDERFVRMGIVGETDWASLGCEVVGEAENGLDACSVNGPSGDLDVYTPSA